MVTEITQHGLIITTSARVTKPLEELTALCDWPVVISATLRRIDRQFEIRRPACLLFWLDAPHEISPTTKLVERLRDRSARPLRVALAYQLSEDAEPALRAAGVHLYLPATEELPAVVRDTLWPWLGLHGAPVHRPSISRVDAASAPGGPMGAHKSPSSARPP